MWTGLFDVQKLHGSLAIEHCLVPHAGTLAIETMALGAMQQTSPPSANDTRRPPHERCIVRQKMDLETGKQHRRQHPHLGYIVGLQNWNPTGRHSSNRYHLGAGVFKYVLYESPSCYRDDGYANSRAHEAETADATPPRDPPSPGGTSHPYNNKPRTGTTPWTCTHTQPR